MNYGQIIKMFREKQGWSLREMSKEINDVVPKKFGISHMAIYQWEIGKAAVPYYFMFYLAQRATGELKEFSKSIIKKMGE